MGRSVTTKFHLVDGLIRAFMADADMTASEQKVIRARVEQLDKSLSYFDYYGRNFNRR